MELPIIYHVSGYVIVKEDGQVLCYSIYNRNEFEDYLLNNTQIDTINQNHSKPFKNQLLVHHHSGRHAHVHGIGNGAQARYIIATGIYAVNIGL
ncbi:HpaII restriction endonuclease [Arenibacter troitsensis]|uniref:HpaII restriction endonuclease n=1 Tax=Arenibacter troitsensis TaxID=188872 RepID=A0A1X7IK60_9FLAO|nr:HpaII restriction endonuclease [Arenibacter troitsensis]